MKKNLTLVILLLLSLVIKAQQIPNAGFTNWINDSTPNGWNPKLIYDLVITTLEFNSVAKTNDGHTGTAAKITTSKTVPLIGTVLPGVMSLGKYTQSVLFGNSASGGFPVSVKVTRLKGYYKYLGVSGDSLKMAVICTKNGDSIGMGSLISNAPQSNYISFDIPLTYSQPLTPDTLNIIFMSSGGKSPKIGSSLFIDDLSIDFDGSGGPETMKMDDFLKLFPNPATDKLHIELQANTENIINIYDNSGKKIFTEKSSEAIYMLNLNGYPNGLYHIEVASEGRLVSSKILISK